MRDYSSEAEALFERLARRHGLRFEIDATGPVEVWWTFPEQERLSLPVVLALQNNDELNFGVGDFWSYFFPFENVVEEFELAFDAWVAGNARIAGISPWTDALQVKRDHAWQTIYRATGLLPRFKRRPVIQNLGGGG
jgi:hypothetical protein